MAGRSLRVLGRLGLHNEFQDRQKYTESLCLSKKKKKKAEEEVTRMHAGMSVIRANCWPLQVGHTIPLPGTSPWEHRDKNKKTKNRFTHAHNSTYNSPVTAESTEMSPQ